MFSAINSLVMKRRVLSLVWLHRLDIVVIVSQIRLHRISERVMVVMILHVLLLSHMLLGTHVLLRVHMLLGTHMLLRIHMQISHKLRCMRCHVLLLGHHVLLRTCQVLLRTCQVLLGTRHVLLRTSHVLVSNSHVLLMVHMR